MGADGWRVWLLGVAVVVLLSSGITSAALIHLDDDNQPVAWDGRVQPLAEFVADERGLEFEHPVDVEFLDNQEFTSEISEEGGELTETDEEDAENFGRLFRAVGLASGDVDLLDSGQQAAEEGILGYYDPERERILVRGTDMTVDVRATLVHELTHALQDQHFDLALADEFETSGQEFAYQALVEGDARRIERAYLRDLPESQLDEYVEESAEEPDFEGVPAALVAYLSAPYELGVGFAGLVAEQGGQTAIDDAFEDPPQSDENIMDPFTFLADDEPVSVDQPELAPNEEEFDSGDWGALTWLLMLGARIDPHAALRAVDGWGGDAYVAFERDDTTCVRIAYVGETPRDTDEMAAALDQWVAAMPPGAASVQRTPAALRLDACDPGPDVSTEFDPDEAEILLLPAARSEFTWELLDGGFNEAQARCVGQAVADSLSIDEVRQIATGEENADLERRVGALVDDCR
ncbi:MAG: hypothetical protein M3179_11460 [Actinomycetota bacterium]|nr:hypothetical protein [Actinomycetota bacterium]